MKKEQLCCMALLCSIFWAGCSGHKAVSSADTTAIITGLDTAFKVAKLVKTADMHFKVKDVKTTAEKISLLTASYKGMVMHHNMRSIVDRSEKLAFSADSAVFVSSYSTDADMVVKIPAVNVDEFLNQVGHSAIYINNRNMDIQDKTLDYLSAQMKLISRTEIINQQKKGIVKIKNPADVMNLKDDLIDQQMDNKRIDDAVKYSTVGLNFYQSNTIAREVVVNDDPSNFKLPFFTRMGQSVASGWAIFTDCILALTNLWVFIVMALAAWIAYRYHKKKTAVVAA